MKRVERLKRMRKYSKVKRTFLVLLCFLLLFSPYMLNLNGLEEYVQAEVEEIIIEEDEVVSDDEDEFSETSSEAIETDAVEEIEGQDIEADGEEKNLNEQEIKEEEIETEINLTNDDIVDPKSEEDEETDVEIDENMLQLNEVIQPFANHSDFVTSNSLNGVTITGYNGIETDLIIPSEIDGKTVTIIGERAFEDKNLTSVVLPNTVVSIANFAFQNNQLSSLQIPASVTHIGNNAFADNKLTTLQIPNTVQGVGQYAFNKNQLGAVTIGSGLTEIRYGVFAYNNLTEITIPNNIAKIDGQAFMENDLQTIVLPNTLQEIGSYAFSFNELTKISIPESVGKIGNDAFRVNKIEEVIVKSSTTMFDGNAIFTDNQVNPSDLMIKSFDPSTAKDYANAHGYSFESTNIFEINDNNDGTVTIIGYKGSETDLIIPSVIDGKTVTVIGKEAFKEKNLTKITLPSTVVTIENEAFRNNDLTNLEIPTSIKNIYSYAFTDNKLTELVIPNTVESITAYAFSNNEIANLQIGRGLTEIQVGIFRGNNLKHVEIPDNITRITSQAFYLNEIETITFPETLQEIFGSAFKGNQLTSLSIPASVEVVHDDAFGGNNFGEVTIYNSSVEFRGEVFSGNRGNITIKSFDPSTAKDYASAHGYSFETINFFETSDNPDGTLTITGYNGDAKDLTIPEEIDGKTVTSIGTEAFKGKGLTKITLPNTVVTISFEAFQGNQLTNLDLPPSVKEIYGRAFADNKLTALVIPDTVERLVYYTFTNNEIETLQIGSGLIEIGDGIFRENKLKHVTIPDNIIAIRNQAFYINEIETIILPETLQVIEGSAFEDNQLTNISIPANVNKIYYRAFSNNLLDEVTIYNPTMIFEENDIFKENKTHPADLNIYGHHLSTAQNHATDNDYTFIAFSSVDSVEILDDIEVDFGTLAADISLPTEVEIELTDGRKLVVPVAWEDPLPYDGEVAGNYLIIGQFNLPAYISNPSDITAEVTITVKEVADPDKEISARYYSWVPLKTGYYDQINLPLPDKVEVSLSDGTKAELEVVWRADSEPVYDKDTVGEYLFSGEFKLIDGITNPEGYLAQRLFVLTDATVNVKYVDEVGNELAAEENLAGKVNDNYTTTAKQIAGYTLTETPVNANGKFTVRDITVNYVYSKEPEAISDKEIIDVSSKGTVKDVGTIELTEIQSLLPEIVIVTLDDNTEIELNVTRWDADSEPAFDKDAVGIYVFSGDIELLDGIANSAGIRAKFSLSLNEIDDPKTDKIITSPYYAWTPLKTGLYEQDKLPLPKVVEVSLDDGSKVELEVVWQTDSEPHYDQNMVGDYVFNGEFKLINGVINPNNHLPTYMIRLSNATVAVKYVDESGNDLGSEEILTGKVNTEYTTKSKEFEGYILTETPTNANGKFTVQDITVTYVYSKDLEVVPDKEIITIISLGTMENVGAKNLADVQLLLPKKVTAILEDDTEVELNIKKWDTDSEPAYDKNTTGTYLFYGDIELSAGIANSAGIRAKFSLSINEDDARESAGTNIKNIPIIGITIETGTKTLIEAHALLPSTVEVELEDGSLIELEVNWSSDSEPSYNKNQIGTYIFTGEFVLKDGITNLNSLEIEYRVNLIDSEKIISPEKEPEKELEEEFNSKDIDEENDSSGLIVNNEPQKPKNADEEDDFHKEKSDSDKILPKTATAYYTFILIGLLLIMLGGIIYTVRKRKQIE